MSGAGSSAAGSSPAGAAIFDFTAQPGGAAYVDDEGNPQGSPYINPITGQHDYNAFGRVKGQSSAQHLVYMALLTVRGSSVLGPDFGLEPPGGTIGSDFVARRKTAIALALDSLIKQKIIALIDVVVDPDRRPVFITILWRDLLTHSDERTTF